MDLNQLKYLRYIKNNWFIAVVLVITANSMLFQSSAYAQDDKYSFRLRGMGQGLYGIIDDLYSDLSINPAYIHRYRGNWLYTNFSNLQGGKDFSLLNQDLTLQRNFDLYPNNLVGTITEYFGTPVGFLLETRGYNILTEDLTSSEQFITATTGTINSSKNIFSSQNASQSFSIIGLVKDFGFKLSIHRNDFSLETTKENTVRNFVLSDTSGNKENSAFVNTKSVNSLDFPNSMIGISIGKIIKGDNQEISIAVGTRPERVAFQSNEILSFFKEPLLFGIAENFDILKGSETGFLEMGFRSIFAHFKLKQIRPTATDLQQNTFSVNFTRYSIPLDIDTKENSVHDSLDVSGTLRKNVTLTRNSTTRATGDGILNRVEVTAGIERHLGNLNTLIAFGVKLDYIWGTTDMSVGSGIINENLNIDVVVGDPAEEIGSYARVISDKKKASVKSDLSGSFLSIPIGLETRVTDRLTIRLGARSIIPIKFKAESSSSATDMPDELLKTDEDNTTFTPQDGAGNTEQKTRLFDGKNLNYNSYHFGANFKINDHLNLDLLHFSKITEMDTWWFSLILKY